jgi:hypothetical protein
MIRVAATAMTSRVAVSPRGLASAGKVDRIAALPAAVCTATVTT